MKIKVSYAALHDTFFFQGVNHGDKLDSSKRLDLQLEYDQDNKELIVTFKGKATHLPSSNIIHYTPATEAQDTPPIVNLANPQAPKAGKVKAQVSGPTDHVFAAGPGKVRE
jgi:hypothetical protein